jgi:hypothetical protein
LIEVVVCYLKCCSTICLIGILSNVAQYLERQKDFMGKNVCRNNSSVFIKSLTNSGSRTAAVCRFCCKSGITQMEILICNFQICKKGCNRPVL